MAGYRYLVDANTLSDFIRNPNGSVTKRLAVVGVATVAQASSLPVSSAMVWPRRAPLGSRSVSIRHWKV